MKKTEMNRRWWTFGIGLIVLSLWILIPAASAGAMLQQGTENDIPFVSGGVGDEEQCRLKEMAGDYNVKMVFAAMSGAYLTDVNVTIRNAQGQTVMDQDFGGPWVYMKLPPGTYDISADLNGIKKEQQVTVGGKLKKVLFHWKVH